MQRHIPSVRLIATLFAIFLFTSNFHSREFVDITLKTVFNDDVEHQVGDLYEWKKKELHLYNETNDERYLLQSQFVEYFIIYNINSPMDKSNFKRLMDMMLHIQYRSKNRFPDLYVAATFQIGEMTMPYAPKLAKSQLDIVLANAVSAEVPNFIFETYFILGRHYQSKREFQTAKNYYEKALAKTPSSFPFRVARTHRDIASCDISLNQLKAAEVHVKKALQIVNAQKNISQNEHCSKIGIEALGGYYQFKIGNNSTARPILDKAFHAQKLRKECVPRLPRTAEALLTILHAEGNTAKYNEILNEIEEIRGIFSGAYYELAFVKLMHESHEKIGNKKMAAKYFKRLNEIYDEREKLNSFINEQIIELLIKQQNIEAEEKQAAIMKSERNKDAAIYISMLIVILIFGFGAYRKYFQKEKETQLALDKLKESEWKKEMLLKEVKTAQDSFQDLNTKLNAKIEQEQTMIDKIRAFKQSNHPNTEALLNDLQQTLLNSEKNTEDVSTIAAVAEEKETFFQKLKLKHPELSAQELNLCSYVRLQLNSKEISLISGITPGSVRVYKTKLKNKLGLKHEENLNRYLELI